MVATMQNEHQALIRGAGALGVPLTDSTCDRLLGFLDLLEKWNRAYNLTSVRNRGEMLHRHLLDSISLAPFIRADEVLDVGSGGGLPGVVMALLYPHRHFTLLDANQKKSRFLTQCRIELTLENMAIVADRAENYRPPAPLAQITSRAFTALPTMIGWCGHLLAEDGEFLAMKGQFPHDEVAGLPEGWQLVDTHPVQVPGVEGQRHILSIRRA